MLENINNDYNTGFDTKDDVVIVLSEKNATNGQDKCPACGSTDISPTINGMLRCNFCRHEFKPIVVSGLRGDINELKGTVIGAAAQDIDTNADSLITLKCSSCGAEVVINTENTTQARCHWCRNTLSINNQIPNGAVPDMLLPFSISKDEAQTLIDNFVGKRRFFAHPTFKKEFTTENIMGFYYPYMVVDAKAHVTLDGEGEILRAKHKITENGHETTKYDADAYQLHRAFDITIKGLTIESSANKLRDTDDKTNNIINSIMPFDTENAVQFNSNYMRGYTSEKRDMNISNLEPIVDAQLSDIVRYSATTETASKYDRGVNWTNEDTSFSGKQWRSAFLPVWMYSYYQKDKGLLHYVAVNGRTKETQGSVPIHMPKLIFFSVLVELICLVLSAFAFMYIDSEDTASAIITLLLLGGLPFYGINYFRYRNSDARHFYERETNCQISNMKQSDKFIKTRKMIPSSRIDGENGKVTKGSYFDIQERRIEGLFEKLKKDE